MAALMLAPAAGAAAAGKAGFSGVGRSVATAAAPAASGAVAARGPAAGPLALSRFDLWTLAAVGLLCALGWLALAALCSTAPVRPPSAAGRPARGHIPEVARA